MAKDLSRDKCVLLTVHYASSANITALHSFTPSRSDVLDPDLVLRILLTYLPEATEPKRYTKYVEEVASRLYLDYDRQEVEVDVSPVQDISDKQAAKQVKQLHLQDIVPPRFPPHAPEDLLVRFLIHRAYNIDENAGLLNLVPALIEPFLERAEYLRTWYISVVLPILRMTVEYYPNEAGTPQISLSEFSGLDGPRGTDVLLRKGKEHDTSLPLSGHANTVIGRDVKCLVGPWMYGHTERKRRKLHHEEKRGNTGEKDDLDEVEVGARKISLEGISDDDYNDHDWQYIFKWLVKESENGAIAVATHLIEDWDGPSDVDLGGFSSGGKDYIDEEVLRKLQLQYAQAAFAVCYACDQDTEETIKGAHSILARLAELLNFIPPPDLATSVSSLPRIERHAVKLERSEDVAYLEPQNLLTAEHRLTTPRLETYMLLQMVVYSAYQLAGLGYPISMVHVIKLHFYQSPDEQLALLQKVLRKLSQSGARKDDAQWTAEREKLLWLWNWGIEQEDGGDSETGAGVLGKIPRERFEEEMLKVFIETGSYSFATRLYLHKSSDGSRKLLSEGTTVRVVLAKAMEFYDGASNGNRNRGGMKKANDTINAFKGFFNDAKHSRRFHQATSLIAATHALSFYSLTLQHGVPFQPVTIRVSSDPVGLIDKVLEQNSRSYTKLDDLVAIATGFVEAGLPPTEGDDGIKRVEEVDAEEIERRRKEAERRVTFMAVETALREDDFETAYSYIINRLTPAGADLQAPAQIESVKHARNTSTASANARRQQKDAEDNTSWRAAFLAGRYRPATSTPPTLRRLEQRTELLSIALLLAPTSRLTDILASWRRVEEEMTALQTSQQRAAEEFDDRADKRGSISHLPGNFTVSSEQPELILNQKRREVGRFGASEDAGEAPMSMFDLSRKTAAAISRKTFPLFAGRSSGEAPRGLEGSVDSLASGNGGGERVRKRDMVANAVSGTLTSGLGWVLGATPAQQQPGGHGGEGR